MDTLPFYALFPKISTYETHALNILTDEYNLPIGEYVFIDSYCTDRKCDCRRALIRVNFPRENMDPVHVATISYCWEPKAFYLKWSPSMPASMLDWFKGPALEPFQTQSKYSEVLLEFFKERLKEDDSYRKQLIRHYTIFKQKTGMKIDKDLQKWIGSSQPCGCKSGEIFRLCCGAIK